MKKAAGIFPPLFLIYATIARYIATRYPIFYFCRMLQRRYNPNRKSKIHAGIASYKEGFVNLGSATVLNQSLGIVTRLEKRCISCSTGVSSYPCKAVYCSSVTGSHHSLLHSSPGTSMAIWLNQLSALAPCQCLTSGGMVITVPGVKLTADLPSS